MKNVKKKWRKYKWEFLRRDATYIKAYREILDLRKQWNQPIPKTKLDRSGNVHPYFRSPAAVKERYY